MANMSGPVSRLLFLSGWIAALLVITARPDNQAGSAHAAPPAAPTETVDVQSVEATDAAYRDTANLASSPTSMACSSWDVSPMAMEAILDEMIRRGWRPPMQGDFLASASVDGVLEAADVEAAAWVDAPPANPSQQIRTEPERSLDDAAAVAVLEAPATDDIAKPAGVSVTSESSMRGARAFEGEATEAGVPPNP